MLPIHAFAFDIERRCRSLPGAILIRFVVLGSLTRGKDHSSHGGERLVFESLRDSAHACHLLCALVN
jgi:hypothetical protein